MNNEQILTFRDDVEADVGDKGAQTEEDHDEAQDVGYHNLYVGELVPFIDLDLNHNFVTTAPKFMSEKKDISVKMKDSYLVECKVVVLVGIGFVYALEDHNGESNDHVQADHSARDSSDH